VRRRRAIEQMIGNGVAGTPAGFEGRMDAAGRQRRDDAGGVADQQHALVPERCHAAADRYEAAATADDAGAAEIEQPCQLGHEAIEVGAHRLAAGEPDLRNAAFL